MLIFFFTRWWRAFELPELHLGWRAAPRVCQTECMLNSCTRVATHFREGMVFAPHSVCVCVRVCLQQAVLAGMHTQSCITWCDRAGGSYQPVGALTHTRSAVSG